MSSNIVCNNLTTNGNSTIGANGANALLINANTTFANGVTFNTANITHNGNLITNQPIFANNGIVLTGNLTGNFNIPVFSVGNTESNHFYAGRENSYPIGNTTTISPNAGTEIFWNTVNVNSGQTDFLNKCKNATVGGFTFNTVTFSAPPTTLFASSSSLFDVKTDTKISNTTASTTTTNGALVVSGGVGVTGNLNISGTGNIPILNSTTGTITTLNSTTGTITTLNSTTGTITTLNSTTGTITTLNSTTVNGGRLNATNTTPATNTTSGALVVSGGVGIAGNTHIGGLLNVAGNVVGNLTGNINGSTVVQNSIFMNATGGDSLYFLSGGGGTTTTTNVISRIFGTPTTNGEAYLDFNNSLNFRSFSGGNSTSVSHIMSINSTGVNVNGNVTTSGSLIATGNVDVTGTAVFSNTLLIKTATSSGIYFINSGNSAIIGGTNTTALINVQPLNGGSNSGATYYDYSNFINFRRNIVIGSRAGGAIDTMTLNDAGVTIPLKILSPIVNSTGSSLQLGVSGTPNAVTVYAGSTQLNNQYLFINSPSNNNNFLCGRSTTSKPTTSITGGWSNPIVAGLEVFWNGLRGGLGQTDFLNYANSSGSSTGGFTFSTVTYSAPPKSIFEMKSDLAIFNTNVSINKTANSYALDVSGNINCSSIYLSNSITPTYPTLPSFSNTQVGHVNSILVTSGTYNVTTNPLVSFGNFTIPSGVWIVNTNLRFTTPIGYDHVVNHSISYSNNSFSSDFVSTARYNLGTGPSDPLTLHDSFIITTASTTTLFSNYQFSVYLYTTGSVSVEFLKTTYVRIA